MISLEQWGGFDVDNYGDLLFPLILERELRERLGAIHLTLASPQGGTFLPDPSRQVRRIDRFEDPRFYAQALDIQALVLGGGDIIRFDDRALAGIYEMDIEQAAEERLFRVFLEDLRHLARIRPVYWNAVGVPFDFSREESGRVRTALRDIRYLSVRDDVSRTRLHQAGVQQEITVVPDTGLLVPRLFSEDELERTTRQLRSQGHFPVAGKVLTVQVNLAVLGLAAPDAEEAFAALLLRTLDRHQDLTLVLLPIGNCLGDLAALQDINRLMSYRAVLVDKNTSLQEVAAVIAHSDYFVGSSLHGNITAFGYGVDSLFLVTSSGFPTKSLEYARLLSREACGVDVIEAMGTSLEGLLARQRPSDSVRYEALQQSIDRHFDHLATAIESCQPATDSRELARCLDEEHQETATAYSIEVGAFTRRITEWEQSVEGLTEQLAERTTALLRAQKELAEEGTALLRAQTELAETQRRLTEQAATAERAQRALDATAARLGSIERRLSWRLLSKAWEWQMRLAPPDTVQGRAWLALTRAARIGMRLARPQSMLPLAADEAPLYNAYEEWARRCEEFRYNATRAANQIETFSYKPIISIVMPTYDSNPTYVRKALDSVLQQYYPFWELCVCDDASPAPHVKEILAEYATKDDRIHVVYAAQNGGIVAASNEALALCTGEFVAFLDHDDELTPDALYEVTAALQLEDADLIYSDEDKLDEYGRRCEPFFKPAWSPNLVFSANCISHFSVYRRRIVEQVGGFREGYDGAQDYDLTLRFVEQASGIAHIPKVLYHWRKASGSTASGGDEKPWAFEAATRALTDALARRGLSGEVERLTPPGFYRVKRPLTKGNKVSIIIPTRNRVSMLRRCIDSIEAKTTYPDYEIIIVHNGSETPDARDYLDRTRHRVLRHDAPFNHSQLCNLGAKEARGEYLLLLHDDTEPLTGEWLSAMVEHAQRPEVGAVGAKLRYPNGRVQHAGIVLGGGAASHYEGFVDGRTVSGYSNFGKIIRDCSAVTGACMMVRRDLFNAVNGLDEDLRDGYNDIDLCLRLQATGRAILFTPHAFLRHHTSASDGQSVDFRGAPRMVSTWGSRLANDPYYHPSLDATSRRFAIDLAKLDAWAYTYSHKVADAVVEPLGENHVIGQEFPASADGLCAVGVLFGTYRRRLQGIVRFHLRESPMVDQDIVVVETPASLIEDCRYHLFSFDPVPNSASKTYYFYIEFLAHLDAALTLWKSEATDPAAGPYHENHHPQRGTLTFNAYCLDRGARYSRITSAS